MSHERYIVNKTSFEMFDAFRAYGLASILGGREEVKVRIRDVGYAFWIDATGDVPKSPNPMLFEDTRGWVRIFGTYRERKDSKKKHPRKEVEELVAHNYDKILEIHGRTDFVPTIGRQVKDGKTLYQSLDVSAAKGYREEKRDVYHEGTQLEVDKYSWAVACIGAAWSGVWPPWGESFIIGLVPNPFDVMLISHRTIQNDLDTKVCTISANTALIHYSIRLAILISERQLSHRVKYDSVIFNVMKKTGRQPKPGGGGKYGLNFLENLAKTSAGVSALKEIDRKFPLSSYTKGIKQSLALTLTDFLMHPDLENFRAFESLYIRGQIDRKFYPWEKDQLEEILNHVEVA